MGDFVVWVISLAAVVITYVAYKRGKPVSTLHVWTCPRCAHKNMPYVIKNTNPNELAKSRAYHEHLVHDDPWPSNVEWLDPRPESDK